MLALSCARKRPIGSRKCPRNVERHDRDVNTQILNLLQGIKEETADEDSHSECEARVAVGWDTSSALLPCCCSYSGGPNRTKSILDPCCAIMQLPQHDQQHVEQCYRGGLKAFSRSTRDLTSSNGRLPQNLINQARALVEAYRHL